MTTTNIPAGCTMPDVTTDKHENNRFSYRKSVSAFLASVSLFALTEQIYAADSDQDITEIIVESDEELDKTRMSPGTKALLKTPGNFGDPIQALLSLPGISFGGSDLSEPVVRGSGPQDNLFLIDGMEIGYLFHKLSDSTLSQHVVHSFDMKAAAYSAEYGNATGGVIDVSLRDPSGDDFKTYIDIGMLKSGILMEGGLTDNVAFYLGGRYNTAHIFMTQFEEQGDGTTYTMPKSHDVSGRIQWKGDSSSLSLTAIYAKDIEQEVQDEGVVSEVPLGFKNVSSFLTLGVKYQKTFENGGEFATTISRSSKDSLHTYSGIRFEDLKETSYYLRSHYSQTFGEHNVKVGYNFRSIKADFIFDTQFGLCNNFDSWCVYTRFFAGERKRTFNQSELYLKDVFTIGSNVQLGLGLQLSKDHTLDQTFLEPRVGVYWNVTHNTQIYARAGKHHQVPPRREMLLFTPPVNSTSNVDRAKDQRNEKAQHAFVGFKYDMSEKWYVQTEAYYKDIFTSSNLNTGLARQIDGEAYGLDFLLAKKDLGEGLYGWLAVSYGKTNRTDKETGEKVNYRYDTPLSATLALNYNFGGGWNFGTKLRVQSGDTYTPVDSIELRPRLDPDVPNSIANRYNYTFGEPNSLRSPTYSRLDVRLEKQSEYSFGSVTYYVDIVNALGRENESGRNFPARLITGDEVNGFQVHPETDTNIPFFAAFGVNIAF